MVQIWESTNRVEKPQDAAANLLTFSSRQMSFFRGRLLELGLDVSDPHKPRLVPVPVARHPRTKGEVRRWNVEPTSASQAFVQLFAVVGAGTHAVYTAVGEQALSEFVSAYLNQPVKLSNQDWNFPATTDTFSLRHGSLSHSTLLKFCRGLVAQSRVQPRPVVEALQRTDSKGRSGRGTDSAARGTTAGTNPAGRSRADGSDDRREHRRLGLQGR